MVTRLRIRFGRRSRLGWAGAWLAIALNVAAPVIAYATTLARIDASAHATHHHGEHEGHHHADGDGTTGAGPTPLPPHCQYCLDFAAGAPLVLVLPDLVAASATPNERPLVRLSRPRSAQHRFAYARGPPSAPSLTA